MKSFPLLSEDIKKDKCLRKQVQMIFLKNDSR